MTYKIVNHDDWRQDLIQVDPAHPFGPQPVLARLIKTPPAGWLAHRGASGVDPTPLNVNRLINQPDGPDQIAAALGLSAVSYLVTTTCRRVPVATVQRYDAAEHGSEYPSDAYNPSTNATTTSAVCNGPDEVWRFLREEGRRHGYAPWAAGQSGGRIFVAHGLPGAAAFA